MKVLLISPSTGKEDQQVARVRKEPLGACYISAFLRKNGHFTRVIDQFDKSDNQVLNEVKSFQPDIVGFSTMTYNYPDGILLAERIKQENKNIPIIFGGSHASGVPEIVKEKVIDFAVIGEGEKTTLELINFLQEKNNDFEKIKGISFLKNNKVIITPSRPRIKNLDSLPFPDRSNLPMKKYKGYGLKYPYNRNNLATIHSARGCRYSCTFCSSVVTWKGDWFARSAKNVVDEMEHLINDYKINDIFFADEDFMKDKNRIYEICDEIIRRKISISWTCFSKITDIEHNLLKRMKEAGCTGPMVGIESMNDETLKKIAKKITTNDIKDAVKIMNEEGMITWGTYMIGYPWETFEELNSGLKKLKKLKVDYIYLAFITPFPGTPFYNQCKKDNLINTDDFRQYDCTRTVLKTPLPQCDYYKMRRKFEKNFYTSPYYLIRVVKNIIKKPEYFFMYRKFYKNIFRILN